MNNIINSTSSSSAGYYGEPRDAAVKKNAGDSFAETVEKKAAELLETRGSESSCLDSLSMDEYKIYIYFKISDIQRKSPYKNNFVLADISDEGFAAMKADPEYEEWVLGKIKSSLYYNNTWEKRDGTNYFILFFGATKYDYREDFWFSGELEDERYEKKSEECFWDARIKRQRKLDLIYFEKLDKRRAFEKKLYEKSVKDKADKRKYENSRCFLRRG